MITDVRRALDDKDVDAISIATPNHWHSLITIWACQAGKDVYVEKPCSHNIHEGRMAVETARRFKRIVQHGTQGRSNGDNMRQWRPSPAATWETAGLTRAVLQAARHHRLQRCHSAAAGIGFQHLARPRTRAAVPRQPGALQLALVLDFGNGDIGNQGVHEMDRARWGIPGATLPKSVISFGGRFGYEDQGQTPNTQIAMLIMAMRNSSSKCAD